MELFIILIISVVVILLLLLLVILPVSINWPFRIGGKEYFKTIEKCNVESLTDFYSGSGNNELYPQLWVKGASLYIPQTNKLLKEFGNGAPPPPPPPLIPYKNITPKDSKLFIDTMNKFGSDKCSGHDYQHVYLYIIDKLGGKNAKLRVLEIGLGTDDPNAISTMSHSGNIGKPGASLKAFKEYLPNSEIFGADIDKNILFEEDRIKTAYVDQLEYKTFDEMFKIFGTKNFDLIIDDGLHSIGANLNTLLFALRHIKVNGWIVIEDINQPHNWEIISNILSQNKNFEHFMRGQLFVVHKLKS